MSSPKTGASLGRLGQDVRSARLRRGISVADLAARAGTSPSTIGRLEGGDPGVALGTLSDILVVFGLVDRLADLIDVRKDDLGLALDAERIPRRGRSLAGAKTSRKTDGAAKKDNGDRIDRDGVAF